MSRTDHPTCVSSGPGWSIWRSGRFVLPVLVLSLSATILVRADDDDPELTPLLGGSPPVVAPRVINPTRLPSSPNPARATIPTPVPETPPIISTPRAVLAIPGMFGSPSSSRSVLDPTPTESPTLPSLPEGLSVPSRTDTPARDFAEFPTLDDLAGDVRNPAVGPTVLDRSELAPLPGPSTPRSSRSPLATEPLRPFPRDSASAASAAAPPRRRLFGLLPAPAVVSPLTASSRDTNRTNLSGPSSSRPDGEQASEVIAEARLQQRIDKQVHDLVGDRARVIEVRVQGKTAVVRASGVKFYQKRAVRKSIESVPALTGMRTTIDVLD